jgi:hypothetical protein
MASAMGLTDLYNDPTMIAQSAAPVDGLTDSSSWANGFGEIAQSLSNIAPTIVNSIKAFNTPNGQLVYNPTTGTNQVYRVGTQTPTTVPLNVNSSTLLYIGIAVLGLVLLLRK